MIRYKQAKNLQKGDKVAIVSMASAIKHSHISLAQEMLESQGFQVVLGKSVLAQFHNFAGDDFARAHDLQTALDDPSIKAIFSSRGGYGITRYLDTIDFSAFLESPKWIVGFSDITALHFKIQSLGYQSIHGPMPSTFKYDQQSFHNLVGLLKGQDHLYSVKSQKENQEGKALAPVIGGNLCLMTHTIGSDSDISYDDKILLLEDIGEQLYSIDRMMVQLKRAQKLKHLAGLIVGDFSNTKDQETPFGKSTKEIIMEHLPSKGIPVAFGFPIGHDDVNVPIPLGRKIELTVNSQQSTLATKPNTERE